MASKNICLQFSIIDATSQLEYQETFTTTTDEFGMVNLVIGNGVQVGGTTANGVNCANVDILISTNGGSTWSTLLAATPNDGTQVVTIPNTPGTTNRIMVKGYNHVFFDISNNNFAITAPTSTLSLVYGGASGQQNKSKCQGNSTSYTLN